ncbi:BnaC04g03860D [Brassica napus]|nr:BnaC04g03860D [Brassica napus]
MDLEQGIKLTSFTDNEPPKMILDKKNESDLNGAKILVKTAIEDPTMENVTGTDNVGKWSEGFQYCCFYRVPNWLRRVNPEAYTPQMLLLGPLQHSKSLELSKTDLRYLSSYIHISSYELKSLFVFVL